MIRIFPNECECISPLISRNPLATERPDSGGSDRARKILILSFKTPNACVARLTQDCMELVMAENIGFRRHC